MGTQKRKIPRFLLAPCCCLVAMAGELATEAGLTGWGRTEATWAAGQCFDAWLHARGGAGNGEVRAMLRQVRRFMEVSGEGRFTWWHRAYRVDVPASGVSLSPRQDA